MADIVRLICFLFVAVDGRRVDESIGALLEASLVESGKCLTPIASIQICANQDIREKCRDKCQEMCGSDEAETTKLCGEDGMKELCPGQCGVASDSSSSTSRTDRKPCEDLDKSDCEKAQNKFRCATKCQELERDLPGAASDSSSPTVRKPCEDLEKSDCEKAQNKFRCATKCQELELGAASDLSSPTSPTYIKPCEELMKSDCKQRKIRLRCSTKCDILDPPKEVVPRKGKPQEKINCATLQKTRCEEQVVRLSCPRQCREWVAKAKAEDCSNVDSYEQCQSEPLLMARCREVCLSKRARRSSKVDINTNCDKPGVTLDDCVGFFLKKCAPRCEALRKEAETTFCVDLGAPRERFHVELKAVLQANGLRLDSKQVAQIEALHAAGGETGFKSYEEFLEFADPGEEADAVSRSMFENGLKKVIEKLGQNEVFCSWVGA